MINIPIKTDIIKTNYVYLYVYRYSILKEDVNHEKYHEICLYFLIDISHTNLLEKGEKFTLCEGPHTHTFEWLTFERLKNEYLYPMFIKDKIFDLPQHLTILTEYE